MLTYTESLAVHGANRNAPVVWRILCQLWYISGNVAILIAFTFPVEFLDVCSEILEIGNYELVSECSCDKDNVFFENVLEHCLIQAQTFQGTHAAFPSVDFSQVGHHLLRQTKSNINTYNGLPYKIGRGNEWLNEPSEYGSVLTLISNLEAVVILFQARGEEGVKEFPNRDVIVFVSEHVEENIFNVRRLSLLSVNT